MSGRSFRSVFMVASCAGAALGCYLVSLRVASERAALEEVETQIVLAQRDIRVLQTEIGTRGRLAQLERWNVRVLALSAPTADQFLKGSFELARMTTPERKDPIQAPVVLASAPAPDTSREDDSIGREDEAPVQLLHEASLRTQPRRTPSASRKTAVDEAPTRKTEVPKQAIANSSARKAAEPAKPKIAEPAASKKIAKPEAKAKKSAERDPLAPLPEKKVKVASAAKNDGTTSRDSARKQ